MKILAKNKKAFFDFEILEKFEAGISLLGQEVKSIKTGKINLDRSYVVLKNNEVFWIGANIPPYQPRNIGGNFNPQRDRKLLLKKREIKYLIGKSKQKGLTLVPLKVYTKRGIIKLEFGVGKRKKKKEKKEKIKEREVEREIERELKEVLR